jgi:hypothetical protein
LMLKIADSSKIVPGNARSSEGDILDSKAGARVEG